IELRRQGLVVGQNDGCAVELLDDLGHGVGLTRTGYTQQNLVLFAGMHAPRQLVDGLALIAFGLVVAGQSEVHGSPLRKNPPRRHGGTEELEVTTSSSLSPSIQSRKGRLKIARHSRAGSAFTRIRVPLSRDG